jgi:hypothetical protein
LALISVAASQACNTAASGFSYPFVDESIR